MHAVAGTVTLLNAANWENRWGEHPNAVVQGPPLPGARSSTTACGCTSGSRSASAASRNLCSNAVSWSATRRSGGGAPSSGRPTPTGCADANGLRRRRAQPGEKWPLDEVFIEDHWSATLSVAGGRTAWQRARCAGPVPPKWNAAKRFFRKLLKGLHYVPRVIVTDKLASRSIFSNRAENSYQPTRQREHAMKRFTTARHAQRFLSAFSGISPHSGPTGTDSRHPSGVPRWPTVSRSGRKSPRPMLPPDSELPGGSP